MSATSFVKAVKYIAEFLSVLQVGKDILAAARSEKQKNGDSVTRKSPDSSQLTPIQQEFIVSARREWEAHNAANPTQRRSLQSLADHINTTLGTHKTARTLSRVWSPKPRPKKAGKE